MKKLWNRLRRFWYADILKKRTMTVWVRGRVKEKNSQFFKEYGSRYIHTARFLTQLFKGGNTREAILEIGFGDGHHLIEKAKGDTEALYVGAEMYSLGVILAAKKVHKKALANVALLEMDARAVVEKSPDNFWKEIYVLFPDPWRKSKHWKRRILQQDFIESLLQKTKSGGSVTLATDWESYTREIRERLENIQKGRRRLLSYTVSRYVNEEESVSTKHSGLCSTAFAKRAMRDGREIEVFDITVL